MGKKKFAKEPLLYIHQSTVQNPKAPMQDRYTTPKRAKGQSQEQSPDSGDTPQKKYVKKTSFQHQAKSFENEEADPIDEVEEPADEKNEQSKNKRVAFKDMNIEERIAYFTETSPYAPKKRCEIRTDERAYRGVITEYKDKNVFIQVGNRKSSTAIPIDAIKKIRLLGF
ncbi:CotO family spore coat protein [Virgibacillus ainsalahensis]